MRKPILLCAERGFCRDLKHRKTLLLVSILQLSVWWRWLWWDIQESLPVSQGLAVRLTLKPSSPATLGKLNKGPGLVSSAARSPNTPATCANTLKLTISPFLLDSSSAGCVIRSSKPDTVLQHTCLRTTEMSINIKWKIDSICFTSNRTGIHRTKNGQWCVFQGHITSFWRSVFEPKCWEMKRPGHMTALSVGNRAWIFRSPVFTSSPSTFPTTTDIIVKSVLSFVKPRMLSHVTKSNVDAR